EDQKRKLSILYSTPEWKKIFRERLRKTRHNQQKPNQLELKIKKILTDAGLVFNPERNFDKFIQSNNKSNFAMLINVPFFHLDLQQEFKEADFLIPPNKIIEHNGTYPHADPRKYPSNKKIWDKSAEEKWKLDEMILDSLKQLGYEVLVVWQLDLEKDAEKTRKRILKFAKS
ncbi:hypothetical protein PL987_04125, partial [Nitrosopumilus sp.]|nr:hypothetical protein [Nitrosopumilus sp.]